MKKAMLRKSREMSEKELGKKETDKIIKETIEELLEEIKPKRATRKKRK